MLDVRMLCLATLMGHEASGYDIKKELERGVSSGMIDASFGSIYPALARLADEGLITARAESGRGRGDKKIYAMTPEGRAYFLRTLAGPMPDEKYRSPFLFAMLFAADLPRDQVVRMIDAQIAVWEARLALADQTLPRDEAATGPRFVNGIAQTMLRAGLDFLRRHRAGLEAAAAPSPQPASPAPQGARAREMTS